MFIHSCEWGFDVDYPRKKVASRQTLSALGLPQAHSFLCRYSEIAALLPQDTKTFLIIVQSQSGQKRQGYFGISLPEQLSTFVVRDFGKVDDSSDLVVFGIEQLEICEQCFTAAFFSNGKGDLCGEAMLQTVDNRLLTSGSDGVVRQKRIFAFSGFELTCCNDFYVMKRLYRYLNTCLYFKGYYEVSYARCNGEKGVFFTYFSDDPAYQNIFRSSLFDISDPATRCIDRTLRSSGYYD